MTIYGWEADLVGLLVRGWLGFMMMLFDCVLVYWFCFGFRFVDLGLFCFRWELLTFVSC